MEVQNEKCSVCGNRMNNQHFHIKEKMFLMKDDGFDYLLCKKCGTLQLNSAVDNLSEYYPKEYNCFDSNEEETLFKKLYHRVVGSLILYSGINAVNNKEFAYVSYFSGLNIKKKSSILDVGCGSGMWLDKLSRIGFRNLTGVDLYNTRKVVTNGKWNFMKGQIFDVHKKFDLITLHHSFEHMDQPLKVLLKVKELLNTEGICIIRIPVMGKYAWRNYKENWVQIDAPRHLFLYTERAMRYLGRAAGLKLVKTVFDSTEFQFWGSEVYSGKNISLSSARRMKSTLFKKEILDKYKKMAVDLNKKKDGDQAIFVFKVMSR